MKPGKLISGNIQIISAVIIVILLVACGGKIIAPNQPSPEPAAAVPAAVSPAANAQLPIGVFVDTHDGYGVTYCNLQGQPVTELKTPNAARLEPGSIVIAGKVSPGPVEVPIVFLAVNPEPGLMINRKDQLSPLVAGLNIFQIAGAPGLPVLAFSRVDPQDKGQTYKLFAGTLDSIASAAPIISHYDEKFLYVYNPLAVEADENAIKGVWYTRTPWGVGGEGFIGNHGLYYYDYASGEIRQLLEDGQNLQGFSPDHTMAAVMDESVPEKPVMKLIDLKTGESAAFAVEAGSSQGGGLAKFSPDNGFVAWMEAGGTSMSDTPDYHSRLRVARLGASPQMVLDLTDAAASKALGFSEVFSAVPAGWLDGQTLLVNAHGGLYKLDAASGNFSAFCPGTFAAFAYD